MKAFNLVLILALFIAIAGCDDQDDAPHDLEQIDMTALRAELQEKENAYAKAENAGDAEAIANTYYAADAQSLPDGEPIVKGRAAIMNRMKEGMAKDTSGATIEFTVLDVFAHGNLAVEVGKSTREYPDGSTETGKYISVFEKRDGEWICIRDIWNADDDDDDTNAQAEDM